MKGGAVYKIPGIPPTLSDFQSNWKINFVGAHGAMNSNMFKVPENTYILNMSTAGKSCSKCLFQLDNVIFDYKNFWKVIHEQLSRGGSNGGKSSFLELIERQSKLTNRMHALYNAAGEFTQTLAFYEPGDIMTDIYLQMYERNPPFFLMGLYNIPIPNRLQDIVQKANKDCGVNEEFRVIDDTKFLGAKSDKSIMDSLNKRIIHNDKNLLKEESEKKSDFTLHEIIFNHLPALSPIAAGQKRILIVGACREASKVVGIRARRYSIGSRNIYRPSAAAAAAVGGAGAAAGGAGAAAAPPAGALELINKGFLEAYRKKLSDKGVSPGDLDPLTALIGELDANRVITINELHGVLHSLYTMSGEISEELANLLNLKTPLPPAAAAGGAGAAAAGAAAAPAAGGP
jgi:hypothetical protein